MSYFAEHFWGEKNHGFDVLYHNMKHGQISAKELADFVRERAAVEETYAKSMAKMSKMAGNSTQLGTFAPLWEVFRISSDKLALCHAELVKKLQDLIKEIGRYGDEQLRAHKKSKDEVAGTLEAVQILQGAAQHLPKAKETYSSRCQELDRLRREGGSQKEIDKAELKSRKAVEALRRAVEKYNEARNDFQQKMLDSAVRLQEVEESHLEQMKVLIGSYIHSVEDTHVQIGQVHEEFKQNMENIGVETLLRNFAESKGTGRHPPGPLDFEELSIIPAQEGPKRTRSKAFRIPGLSRKERERDSVESPDTESGLPDVDEEGFTVRPETNQNGEHPTRFCSSSDSDYDDEEPHKFYIRIKPVQPRERASSAAAVEQLKASVGNLILPPSVGCTMKRHSSRHLKALASASAETDSDTAPAPGDKSGNPQAPLFGTRMKSCDSKPETDVLPASALFGPPLESAFENEEFSAPPSSGDSTSPSPWAPRGRELEGAPPDMPSDPASLPLSAAPGLTPMVAPPRRCRAKRPSAVSTGSDTPRSLSPSRLWALSTPQSSAGMTERAFFMATQPGLGVSRGPSPVVLGAQGALPVATAFTEYIHAYFKGRSPDSCLVKITGELTMSFPAGILRVFSSAPAPPVLSFRLRHTAAIDQFLPNTELLFSDASQSDSHIKDFWLNMAALTTHLQKQAEQAPGAPYYNVTLLRYQYSKQGPRWAPLQLSVDWACGSEATRVRIDYSYNTGALASAAALGNVQILLPIEEPAANVQPQPSASWNLEEKRLLWRLLDLPGTQGHPASGRLLASWEPLTGPSKPSPVAAQFTSEGSTLSGADVELVGSGYRMSLVKKRFATGIYLAGS
ncbi:F-BAR domain only protein 1 isoform X3 [Zootoca vivipara]|uniref:F-BAR domain only protein 1 isoform X3 n=1 Tax=Zootoca vivipara TaxID=8524 RepID=UPI001591DE2A|nr:F-BAR domain only protein 1 isoform X3 [Zootoca vivipara]